MRLDVRVPRGHSRQADLGSVHAARVQNLRWRLALPRPAAGTRRGHVGQGPAANTLPPSLACLANDHPGDAAAKALRPLSPEPRAAPRLRPRRAAQSSAEGFAPPPASPVPCPRWKLPVSPECLNESPGSSAASTALPSPRCPGPRQRVTFSDRLEAEVPLLDPHFARSRRPRRLPAERPFGATIVSYDAEELRARANMAKFAQNSERLSSDCGDCFKSIQLLCRDPRSAGGSLLGKKRDGGRGADGRGEELLGFQAPPPGQSQVASADAVTDVSITDGSQANRDPSFPS